MTFWQWFKEQLFGAQCSEAELRLYAGSQKRAEAEHAEAKRLHDETGEHVWLDATAYGDVQHVNICQFCPEREFVPYAPRGVRLSESWPEPTHGE